ncbi:TnsA endonuclease N-terminal domain-containing protein [Pseudomonas sp. RC2C2]|uniref:TnsA endonuclease N-terminal domain-containing protein n=1 Tax=Pseudomonas sp. RC2C2 TaxID=2834408 RepID=UPI001BCB40C7|nr:TnsA endonuclease N-terminal domain-containing protein [Pseudomonas sp. RC2C2]MBS7596908.1 hypothetical protein [Pseudomonas sp. RC2C2]
MKIPIGLRKPEVCGYYGKHLVFFPSRKNHQSIICNSLVESDYCIFLEWDPKVLKYASQPGDLEVCINGRQSVYRPDFFVETRDSQYFCEVKNDFTQISDRVKAKTMAAEKLITEMGYGMAYADRLSIRAGWKFKNLAFLYFQSFNVSAAEWVSSIDWLNTLTFPLPCRYLLTADCPVRKRAIYLTLFKQIVHVDLSLPLNLDSLISAPSGVDPFNDRSIPAS